MLTQEISKLSDIELESQLINNEFESIEYKRIILQEILKRHENKIKPKQNDMCYWDWS